MPAERHLSYYNLRDAFSLPGCAFCNAIEINLIKYFDDLLYEQVNSFETVKQLSKSMGFCKLHSKILLDFKDSLGIAILYQRILEEYKDNPKAIKEIQNKFCPACLREKEILERYTGVFIDFVDDFLNKFRNNGFPFCAEHFNFLINQLNKIKSHKIKDLKQIQEKNIKNLMNNLENLINSFDYQHSGKKLTEQEKRAWIDAVEIISGRIIEKKRFRK